MKILFANKFYYLKGGAERYYFDLKKLLEKNGHKIISFSMEDKKNYKSEYAKYFVSNVELEKPKFSFKDLKAAGRILYSFEAKKKIEELIKREKPDIAHINNIYHQISPSILSVLKKYKIPIVQTLHDYKMICPVYILYSKNEICERCKKYRYYMCTVRKCTKNSRAASFINTVELYLHKFLRIYENNVDMFIAPSKFLREKILEWKMIPPEKIVLIPHFIDLKNLSLSFSQEKGEKQEVFQNNFLYFGRLSREKGVKILISAMRYVKNGKLLIAGTGPEETELKNQVLQENLKNIEFLGYLNLKELMRVIQKCLFTVLPSIIYESFGLTILESYVQRKAVLGSNLGAIPEVVKDEKTGLLFKAGNSKDLAQKINLMLANRKKTQEMGEEGRKKIEREHTPEQYYEKLIKIYKQVVER